MICNNCNGSGEGQYDSTLCYQCKGQGTISSDKNETLDDEDNNSDYLYDLQREREQDD